MIATAAATIEIEVKNCTGLTPLYFRKRKNKEKYIKTVNPLVTDLIMLSVRS
jgi:hypothetical protein